MQIKLYEIEFTILEIRLASSIYKSPRIFCSPTREIIRPLSQIYTIDSVRKIIIIYFFNFKWATHPDPTRRLVAITSVYQLLGSVTNSI